MPSLANPSVAVIAILLLSGVLAQKPLPKVDLGYEIHQAISLNVCYFPKI
jgi:hypothetical protein